MLANLPFYTLLVPLFLELCVARLEVRGESAAQDLVSVMSVLEEAPALRDLLVRLEKDYNKYIGKGELALVGPCCGESAAPGICIVGWCTLMSLMSAHLGVCLGI